MAKRSVAVVRRSPSRVVYRNSRKRKRKPTIPLSIVGGFMPYLVYNLQNFKYYGIQQMIERSTLPFVPYNPHHGFVQTDKLMFGLYPVAAGIAIHFAARWLGVNRALSRMGVPLVRI